MARLALSVVLLVGSALGCSPGVGTDATIVQNPRFTYTFYPPARWTYYNSPPTGVQANTAYPYNGQATSLTQAQQNMKIDIDAAILKALQNLRVSSVGYTWTTSGYTPFQCLVRENNGQQGWRVVGTCVPEIGAITTNRTTAELDSGTDLVQTGTLTVTTNQLVTRGQWRAIATEVFNQLSMYYHVYFKSAINLA